MLPYIPSLTGVLLGCWHGGRERPFKDNLGRLPRHPRRGCHYLTREVLVLTIHQSVLRVARKLGMLEQLGSDDNNSLSFHGGRKSQVSPMPYFLTLRWSRVRQKCL